MGIHETGSAHQEVHMGVKERRARERAERRQQILEAARQLFLDQGFDQASVEEIAEAAEVSKGLVYFYFRSKDEILAALVRETYSPLLEALHSLETQAAQNPEARLLDFLRLEISFYREHARFFRLVASLVAGYEGLQIRPEYREVFVEAHHRELAVLEHILQEGVHQGCFRRETPRFLSLFVVGPLHSLFLHATDLLETDPETLAQRMGTLVLRGLKQEDSPCSG